MPVPAEATPQPGERFLTLPSAPSPLGRLVDIVPTKYYPVARYQFEHQTQLNSNYRGILVELVLCVLLGHPNSKIANSKKLVTFAFFSSQYHVFELKNIRGNLIAPNSNRWSLSNENAMSQEDNRKIISLFGQEKSIFLHP